MFKKELLKDRDIGVFIENEEQSNLLAKWIEENADRQYNRYDSNSNKHIVNHVLFTSYEHGNCYEFDDKKDAEKKLNKIISFKEAIALEPVSNFNNTWCLNTIKHKNTLLHFQHINLINEINNTFEIYYTSSTDIKRQIQLIDGEFYYADSIDVTNSKFILGSDTHYCPDCEKQVITKEHNCLIHSTKLNDKDFKEHTDSVFGEECQFAKYGFKKPEFECDYIINLIFKDRFGILHGHELNGNESIRWNSRGVCMTHECNLTPIKKPWYEDEINFPCLVKLKNDLKYETWGLATHCNNIDELCINNEYNKATDWERITKEEVLSLYKEQ